MFRQNYPILEGQEAIKLRAEPGVEPLWPWYITVPAHPALPPDSAGDEVLAQKVEERRYAALRGARVDVAASARTSLGVTLQSSDQESTKSPRSTGPRTWWKPTDMTVAVWPL
ncbi:hypothetical protein IMZ48_28965 [Candidatus Bathyarchaeota archaeon]|nr:hypothetical protein [Candidatus Bathyarchaeota archaeon]